MTRFFFLVLPVKSEVPWERTTLRGNLLPSSSGVNSYRCIEGACLQTFPRRSYRWTK